MPQCALFGLNACIIDETQFSLLITVVVASALIPTAIAQTFYHPIADLERPGATEPSARVRVAAKRPPGELVIEAGRGGTMDHARREHLAVRSAAVRT